VSGINVLIALRVQRGHEFAVTGRAHQEMNVRRPVAVPLLRADHVANRTVHRDHVAQRQHGPHVVIAVRVGAELCAPATSLMRQAGRFLRQSIGVGHTDLPGIGITNIDRDVTALLSDIMMT
jgi:hypothetical protein